MKDLRKFETLLGPELTELLRTHAERLSHFHSVEQVYLDLSPIQSEAASAVSSSVNTRQSSRVDESLLNPFILDRVKDQLDTMVLPGYGSVRSSVVDSNFNTDYSKLRATQTVLELNKLKVDLEFSVRNILRVFRSREETMVRLIAECNQSRTREGAFFMHCLTDLKELILQRLLVPPTEQNDKLVYLSQIAAQQKINQSEIDQLEAELQKGIAERDKEVKARNDIIHHLQMNLQMLEKTTDEDIKRVNNEADKQKHADNKASQGRKDRMQTELKSLSYILDNDVIEHREEERLLRMKKYKIECEIENWIQKFDVEMTEKQKEYEEIDAAYQEEKAQLTELEQRFNTLESEYKEIMKLKLQERQRAEEKNRLWQRQTHAVVIIQALWRAYKDKNVECILLGYHFGSSENNDA
ncbi:IQCD [Bugula neritina]|uniref:Dynein regulatory complex protein 10 n=1 Tax=Bugula neritina TaxID=10212 RepID=A0A7J7JP86_BUGNE|nr:IQCD [Bugula neritina]